MGVKGLWSLLSPVARPIKLETLEGKRLAIDSSIWLYQFQATMRDKDGRVLVNAHVLGFLRRINKLLFHGIKPVFVFDGGAPGLKRSTIAERKRKKMGAAANHAKVAERLFAAQMRREAVKAAQAQREKQLANANAYVPPGAAYQFQPDVGDEITAHDVYLEELDGPVPPTSQMSQRPRPPRHASSADDVPPGLTPEQEQEEAEVVAADRRRKFKNHDPYRLPELTEPLSSRSAAAVAGGSTGPGAKSVDPRMATEEELQHFIQEMRPEDFDVNSPEFRALPTEVQYEIIGDLRIRSRQQSHRRLTSMLRAAPTPLDFSRAQIENLSKRNTLTQQLLTVTDTIGTSGLQIPVRVASERNREYVLVRNPEAKGGGWVLGVRDQGTQKKPIEIEESPQAKRRKEARARAWLDSDDEDEVQEIPRPGAGAIDPDLRKMRQQEMLQALTRRLTPKKVGAVTDLKVVPRKQAPGINPLFEQDEVADGDDNEMMEVVAGDAEEQMQLNRALAASLMDQDVEVTSGASGSGRRSQSEDEDTDMQDALVASYRAPASKAFDGNASAGPYRTSPERDSDDESFEEVVVPPSKQTTPEEPYLGDKEIEPVAYFPPTASDETVAETIAEILPADKSLSSVVVPAGPEEVESSKVTVGLSSESSSVDPTASGSPSGPANGVKRLDSTANITSTASQEQDMMPAISPQHKTRIEVAQSVPAPLPQQTPPALSQPAETKASSSLPSVQATTAKERASYSPPPTAPYEPAKVEQRTPARSEEHLSQSRPARTPRPAGTPSTGPPETSRDLSPELGLPASGPTSRATSVSIVRVSDDGEEPVVDNLAQTLLRHKSNDGLTDDEADDVDDSRSMSWSPSASPEPRHTQGAFPTPPPDLEEDEGGIDMNAEGDDYARFIAQIKGRNLDQVRQEIDNEIRTLNMQNKVAMRDSEDITQHMIAQIQLLLRLFGIPYITAPMEAEAQCAKLAELNLVDGVITDDNDVFLFGGSQCFKNLFNDAKYVECFLASDLDRELSLTRERLITIAYLLGSDYTIGLPHVGPIVAMELMANFPGETGLLDFKKWWWDVQNGRDKPSEATKWMTSFKRKYADRIFLGPDWPNPLVREAYNMPTVDESEEEFQWGFPDLTGLRTFLQAELSWSISKADDELTPIVQRIALRGQSGALGGKATQTRLDPFFDMSLGAGAYVPRVRAKHPSKRLQGVIRAYRAAEARARGEAPPEGFGEMLKDLEEEVPLVKVDEVGVEGEGKMPRGKRQNSKTGEEGAKRKRKTPVKRMSAAGAEGEAGDGAGAGVDGPAVAPPPKKRRETRKPSASGASSRAGSTYGAEDGEEAGAAAAPTAAPGPKPRKKKQTIEI